MTLPWGKLYDPNNARVYVAFDLIKQPKVKIWGIFSTLGMAQEALKLAGRYAFEFNIVEYTLDYRKFYHEAYGKQDNESGLHEVEFTD